MGMPEATADLRLELDMDAIHTRSAASVTDALEAAERRIREAERARDAAIRERDILACEHDATTQALAERTKERDDSDVARKQLAMEKRALENETEVLLKRLSELTIKLADTEDTDRQLALSLEMSKLQRRLDERNKALYGSRSERRGRPGEDKKKKKKKRKKRTRSGPRPQPKLERSVQLHLLASEQCSGGCDKCSGDLEPMKDQFEASERITVERVRYEVLEQRQQKYRCTSCKHIVTAPKPKSFMPGGRYTEEFAVKVAVDKHVDSLPLNRQVMRMARRGLEVTTQALCDQLERLYILLVPTLIVLHERILQAALVQADETSWRVMGTGGSKKWWVWTITDGEAVYFQIVPSRGKAAGRQLFKDYAGLVMADDYAVYTALEKERTRQGGRVQIIDADGDIITLPTPDYVLASCWAHARRYFIKAARYHDEAEQALDLIDALFHIEQEAQEQAEAKVALARKAGDPDAEQARAGHLMEARRRLRAERSRAVVAELDSWRHEQRPLPGSAMDEALNHLDKIWVRLLLFLDDPRIPLDNNLSERQVRGPVLGRKNFQGSRSETGTRVSALFYSLLATCRLMGIDPHAYLLEAVRRAVKNRKSVFLPHDFRDMLREKERAKPSD